MFNKLTKPRDDIAYINSTLYNDRSIPIRCEYAATFTSPVIHNAGEYYMAISRFSIPNTQPIFEFLDNTYVITISKGGVDYNQIVLLQSADQNPRSNSVYTYQQFLDMINTALATAYNLFKAANPGSATANAPSLVFNADSDTFSILFDPAYETENIEVYFNKKLYSFFYNSFNVIRYNDSGTTNKDYRFIIKNEGLTRGTQLELKQQINTLFEWHDFQSIVFTSNSLPINAERITTAGSNGSSIDISIITDFIPELGNDRSNFVYNANPYRLVDMSGHQNIDKIDFRVQYINKNGEVKPLLLEPGYSMSVKFVFIHKLLG